MHQTREQGKKNDIEQVVGDEMHFQQNVNPNYNPNMLDRKMTVL